ncbi:MAG: hypothetical protein B6D34_14110 [Candidatus Brocadia sp. UTAMX1]|nr:MAG: hypothetical protein B6D34_14110 [Candidatus Brocadia sp. UTAMX1]
MTKTSSTGWLEPRAGANNKEEPRRDDIVLPCKIFLFFRKYLVSERTHIILSFWPKEVIFKPYNFKVQKVSRSAQNDIFGSFRSDTKHLDCMGIFILFKRFIGWH